ncbi:putative protein YqeN [bioreactor metagenome]|uniref:DNA polymerase III subunit delta n=1 Tax=bioreactor metagenome TaxID=1076179 RepID=A0A645EH22_9ZZZZ
MITKLIKPDFSAFNLHRFEGKEVDLMRVAQCAEALPMMDERMCVVVKDYPLESMNESMKAELESMISDIPKTTVLIFWVQNVSYNFAKDAKHKALCTLFDKYGTVVRLDKRTNSEIQKLIIKGVAQRKCTIDKQTVAYLVDCVGDDLNNLLGELEKLCYYAGQGEITKEMIDTLAIKSVEAKVFDLTKALFSANKDKVFNILNVLLKQKVEPVIISGTLISAYVDMYRAKVFVTSGKAAKDCMNYYSYPKNVAFRLENAARDSSKISIEQLRRCLDILADCDKKLKSYVLQNSLILEETLVKLILIVNGEKV